MTVEPEPTNKELKELLLNIQEMLSSQQKTEPSLEIKEENFPDSWEQPQVLIPDETKPLGQVKNGEKDDGDGEVKHFTKQGIGQAGRPTG